MQPQDTWTSLSASVSLYSLVIRTDQGFLKDEVPQFWPCLFSFRRCCMHLQSYLMRAGGQILWKILMTSFHEICGLGLPQSKILGTPMNWRSPENNFWRLFFGEHLRLCSWSLASSIPVLGCERFCPRQGCPWPWPRIFLCPWPWPRGLCPRLHLWCFQGCR